MKNPPVRLCHENWQEGMREEWYRIGSAIRLSMPSDKKET
jgi:hypothetical protein